MNACIWKCTDWIHHQQTEHKCATWFVRLLQSTCLMGHLESQPRSNAHVHPCNIFKRECMIAYLFVIPISRACTQPSRHTACPQCTRSQVASCAAVSIVIKEFISSTRIHVHVHALIDRYTHTFFHAHESHTHTAQSGLSRMRSPS